MEAIKGWLALQSNVQEEENNHVNVLRVFLNKATKLRSVDQETAS